MIKRIKQIKNVGTFKDFSSGGSVGFEKLTFIYGLNARGKSTLTDVFSSLKENDPFLIIDRKSIPIEDSSQKIEISIKPEDLQSEVQNKFVNKNWINIENNENLYIYGSDFIHKNLFTGLSIERQNKENLTQFILGYQGVRLAKEITDNNRTLRQKRKELSNFLPLYLRDKAEGDYQSFFSIDPSLINLEETKLKIADLENKLRQESQRLKEPTNILSIEDIVQFNVPKDNLQELIDQTNSLLQRDYKEINSGIIAKFQKHIELNFETKEDAELWIKQGLDFRKSDTQHCSFCGQLLVNAKGLFDIYQSYFNEAYLDYISDITEVIGSIKREWRALNYNSLHTINSQQTLFGRYKKLMNDDDFTNLITQLNDLISSTNETTLNNFVRQFFEQVNTVFDNKERIPHETIEVIDFLNLIDEYNTYSENLFKVSSLIEKIREKIKLFKEPYYDLSKIEQKIDDIKVEIKVKKRDVARVEENDACISYQREKREIADLQEEIKQNQERLSQEQSEYLESFFDRINLYFQKFGSENFTLEKGKDNRGHQPVYFLKTRFKDVEINEADISKVFSESDRRALSLSLFWAKIDSLTSEQKQKAIIILDDPVTSFDDNRILKSINQIKDTLQNVRQIIILTHYSHFVRNFVERGMNDNFSISFIEIAQDNLTCFLRRMDGKGFIETTYEKAFSKIQAFINRESEEDIRSDLRPFLESQYLPHFYIKEFKKFINSETPFRSLNEKIEAIFADNVTVKTKFHEFRETLNSDSHIFTSSNDEDVRSFASEMMEYLYGFSHNA